VAAAASRGQGSLYQLRQAVSIVHIREDGKEWSRVGGEKSQYAMAFLPAQRLRLYATAAALTATSIVA
jgi:hypothetical protein